MLILTTIILVKYRLQQEITRLKENG
ncbi:hypothetical protein NC651_027722 [Populus alba x Populus x berolinensis]|nr:hypothetical protein NC651_027722 [Populus alba x Populus x berolinensis]